MVGIRGVPHDDGRGSSFQGQDGVSLRAHTALFTTHFNTGSSLKSSMGCTITEAVLSLDASCIVFLHKAARRALTLRRTAL